jgi:hypothetical protein
MYHALVAATVAAPLRIPSFGDVVSDRGEIASTKEGRLQDCKVPCLIPEPSPSQLLMPAPLRSPPAFSSSPWGFSKEVSKSGPCNSCCWTGKAWQPSLLVNLPRSVGSCPAIQLGSDSQIGA